MENKPRRKELRPASFNRISDGMLRVACVLAVSLLSSSCARFEGTFSFLREQPKIEKIPGVYALDPKAYSFASLKDQGYTDVSGTVTLYADGSFKINRLADCCVYGEYGSFGGYFEGAGTWSVEKSQSVFEVRLKFKDLKRDGITSMKQPELKNEAAFILTKNSCSYGLAAPLFDGEFRYVYFKITQGFKAA
jgi:hypothetical protein